MSPPTTEEQLLAEVKKRYPLAAQLLDELSATQAGEGLLFSRAWSTTRAWNDAREVVLERATALADQLAALAEDPALGPNELSLLMAATGQGALVQGGHARPVLGLAAEHLLYTLLYPQGDSAARPWRELFGDTSRELPALDALASIYRGAADPVLTSDERTALIRELLLRRAGGALGDVPWRWAGEPLWSAPNARAFADAVLDYAFRVYLYEPVLASGSPAVQESLLQELDAAMLDQVLSTYYVAHFHFAERRGFADDPALPAYTRAVVTIAARYEGMGLSRRAEQLRSTYSLKSVADLERGWGKTVSAFVLQQAERAPSWPNERADQLSLLRSLVKPFVAEEAVLDRLASQARKLRSTGHA